MAAERAALGWPLDEDRVARLVAEQFPDANAAKVRRLGAGWDHELFLVDDEWVFRFPKRPARIPWLIREIAIMHHVGPTLADLVPRFDHLGQLAARFRRLSWGTAGCPEWPPIRGH
ncbi:MAG: hypothetical protein ACR2KG_08555 [Nocardioidaceae bacterium]